MKTVLILSGPTHEYFDPVRFIGNASSGKMGKALAEEALKRGLHVDFISGPVPENNLPKVDATPSSRFSISNVTSAGEMLAAAQQKFSSANLILFAAAVADFQPAQKFAEKLPKTGAGFAIELTPAPDIAAILCAGKTPAQTAIGFALQTHDGEKLAREKLISKHLDGIVLNTPATLGAENGMFTWIDSSGTEPWGLINKAACAGKIFEKVIAQM